MPLLSQDEKFLHRALTLAHDAAAFASPNPTVGCVLVHEEQILGEGAHFYDKFDHAEIAALKQAAAHKHPVRGATAYVTLEPCAHHGRTGPCADALVAAGIARCVVATVDPNPLVSGQGIEKMRAAGVEVTIAEPASELAQEARRLNDAFAFSIQNCRPLVTLKAAVSRDGSLAPRAKEKVEPYWLTGPAARADVQRLRHASDAILTGVGTVLADNPSLTDRTGLPRRRRLLRVVLDSELRTPPDAALLHPVHGDVLFVVSTRATTQAEASLRALGAEVLRVPAAGHSHDLDLHAVLQALDERDIRSVLLEAGSHLNASFLNANLADRVVLYRSPVELGPDAVPFASGKTSVDALQAQLSTLQTAAFPHGEDSALEDVHISGYLHDPWAEAF